MGLLYFSGFKHIMHVPEVCEAESATPELSVPRPEGGDLQFEETKSGTGFLQRDSILEP